jgi:hypothetical protein
MNSMTPPRHTLVYIPENSGITRNNLENLNSALKRLESANDPYEHNMWSGYIAETYNKIKQAGKHATRNNAIRVTARPLELYRALERVQPGFVLHHRRFNAAWRKFQEAAGKFKALGKVRAMRKSGNNVSPSRRHLAQHNLHALASYMRPYMLRVASPVRITEHAYRARQQDLAQKATAKAAANARRQNNAQRARNEAAAEAARRQAAPTTRSGRRSVAPKPLSPKRTRRL